jgi:DnaJ-class molecular chaperone
VDGDHLHLNVPITIVEAVRGESIEVPTPDGPVRVRVPPGTIGGERLRLRGRGLRLKGGERGHLYLTLRPTLPEGAPEALAEACADLYPGDVREKLEL